MARFFIIEIPDFDGDNPFAKIFLFLFMIFMMVVPALIGFLGADLLWGEEYGRERLMHIWNTDTEGIWHVILLIIFFVLEGVFKLIGSVLYILFGPIFYLLTHK